MFSELKNNLWLLTLMSFLGLFLAACGQNGTSAGTSPSSGPSPAAASPGSSPATSANTKPLTNSKETSAPNQVVVEEFAFKPAVLTVKPGTSVIWINHDDVPHTVTDRDDRFKSGAMDTDAKFSFTFKTPGTYNYFCALHPRMTGQIIVK
jgi:plastocyanin